MKPTREKRLILYVQHEFARGHSKTAEGMLQYGANPILAIVDEERKGQTAGQVLPWLTRNRTIPVVGSVAETLPLHPEAMLIGTATRGGKLPTAWRQDIVYALEHGMDIVNGLHYIFADDVEFAALARQHGRELWDTRLPPPVLPVGAALAAQVPCQVVLSVGTDCVVGKMMTALELEAAAVRRGLKARFIPTGQTGIMIAGFGISIDRVIGDFMSGATEKLILENAADQDFLFVEGQGSLLHPGYSGVTLGLIHGCMPNKMILCHEATKQTIRDSTIRVPTLREVKELYEHVTLPVRKGKVVGVALNTAAISETQARAAIKAAEDELGLPATDPIRFGVENLLDELLKE